MDTRGDNGDVVRVLANVFLANKCGWTSEHSRFSGDGSNWTSGLNLGRPTGTGPAMSKFSLLEAYHHRTFGRILRSDILLRYDRYQCRN